MSQLRVAGVIAIVLVARVATADPSRAEVLFDQGRALIAEGKYPEACAAFTESLGLDYQIGTLYNLAMCDAKRGKLATALAALRTVVRDDQNVTRRGKAAVLAAQLEPRVPHIVVVAGRGIRIALDGVALPDPALGVAVDLGSHEVIAAAPGRPDIHRTIEITTEGQTVRVELEPAVEAPPLAASSRSIAGKLTTGVGAAVAATGFVLGAIVIRDWHKAEDDARTDPMLANREEAHAHTLASVSTALVIAGVVSVAAGVYLWRSGAHTVQVTTAIGPGHGYAELRATF